MRTKTPQQADRILEAAGRLFGAQRFHQVRMEDIATAAGVGKATLYRYFHDKEELYLALLTRAGEQFLQLMEATAAKPGTVRQRLERVVAAILDHFDRHPHLLDLIQRAEIHSAEGGAFPWQKPRDTMPRLFADLFRQAAADGEFVLADLDLNVLMLLGGLRSVLRFGPRPRASDLSKRIVAAFLGGAVLDPACHGRGAKTLP